MDPQPHLPRLPNELLQIIFLEATFVPYEFDTEGDDLEAARAHLDWSLQPSSQGLKAAIRGRRQISLVCRAWSLACERFLYQTIIISKQSHLILIKDTLKRKDWLCARIRRIDIDQIPMTGVHQLCSRTPNLRTLRINSLGRGRFNWTFPELACIRLQIGLTEWPQMMTAQTLQILDLSGITRVTTGTEFSNIPLLPHLYAVGLWLDEWSYFPKLWSVNREKIRVLSLKWTLKFGDEMELMRSRDHWDHIILSSDDPEGCLPNLTHLITSMIPPADIFTAFPRLSEMEIHRWGDRDEYQGINPYDECLWTWSAYPTSIRMTNIPVHHDGDFHPFRHYHRSLMKWVLTHMQRIGDKFRLNIICVDSNGRNMAYMDLIHCWSTHTRKDFRKLVKSLA